MSTQPRRAFTLIEVLVALALGTLLMLIAVAVFRTASDAMSELGRLAEENALIRAGYFTATDEADTWRAHADPSYPYLAGHLVEAGSAYADQSGHGVRPFAPVTWPTSLDDPQNPHWRQLHDPRTWYRGSIYPNVTVKAVMLLPVVNIPGTRASTVDWDHLDDDNRLPAGSTSFYRHYGGWYLPREYLEFISMGDRQVDGNSLINLRQDFRNLDIWWQMAGSGFTDNAMGLSGHFTKAPRPQGWQMWHVFGDYAALGNVCGWSRDRDGDGVLSDAERTCDGDLGLDGTVAAGEADPLGAARHDHPQNFLKVFQALGLLGCYSYLPPGTQTLITASSVNLTEDKVLDPDQRCRQGEPPFMHQTSVDWINLGLSTAPAGLTAVTSRTGRTAYDPAALGRWNYHGAMPSLWDRMRASYKAGSICGTTLDFDSLLGVNPWYTNGDHLILWNDDMAFRSRFTLRPYRQCSDRYRPPTTQALFYPAGPRLKNAITGLWDTDLLRQCAVNPAYPLDLPDGRTSEMERNERQNTAEFRFTDQHEALYQIPINLDHFETLRERHTRRTWHVPVNFTDDPMPRLAGGGEGGLTMGTAIFRLRTLRCDRAELAVTVADPGAERSLEFRFKVLTTDFRGARQYWGRNSAAANGGAGIAVDPGYAGSRTFLLGDQYE